LRSAGGCSSSTTAPTISLMPSRLDWSPATGRAKRRKVVRGINLITLLWTDGDRKIPCDYRLYSKAGVPIVTPVPGRRDVLQRVVDVERLPALAQRRRDAPLDPRHPSPKA
jgi:hypothetical protein